MASARARTDRHQRARGTAAASRRPPPVLVTQPDNAVELDADRIADLIGPPALAPRSSDPSPLACAPSSVWGVVDSPGRPLAEHERPAPLGADFSQVRVHTGQRASESAGEVGAAAYTLGHDIVHPAGYDPATIAGRRLLAHELAHVAQQQVPGNVAGNKLLRQAAPARPPASATEYDALYDEMWKLIRQVAPLVNKPELGGELNALLAELGGPGEKSGEQLADLRARLEQFKADREKAYQEVMGWWPELTADYKKEDSRLAQSAEASDRRARTLLRESYSGAQQELKKAGRLADVYDVMPFADELYTERHLERAWEIELRQSVEEGEHAGGGTAGHWPPLQLEIAAKAIEGAAASGHISAELREELVQKVDSAIRYQIRHAVTEMVELGESPAAARAWADKAMQASKGASEDLLEKFRPTGMIERWHGALHIAGKLTIAIDIVGSVIDIVASPPREWPKKTIIHGSRLLGGLAGARVGASAGASFGEEIGGPTGATIGGIVGGLAGGLEGSIFVEEFAEFVADEFWPPEDTYTEAHAD